MADLETVKIFKSRTEAMLAKGYLESHGIKALLTRYNNGGTESYPMQNIYSSFLTVDKKDLQKAKELLKQTDK